MSKQILLINCAYRVGSIIDQMMQEVAINIQRSGYTYEMLNLREQEFSHCVNCRVCTQKDGENPGECINRDKMNDIVKLIEQSAGYVIASPAKFYATAKFFECFLSRLIVYSYWPFGTKTPIPKKHLTKKAVLICAFPIPEFIAKIYSKTINQLKTCAKLIGAQPIETIYIALTPISSDRKLSQKEKEQAKNASEKLIASL